MDSEMTVMSDAILRGVRCIRSGSDSGVLEETSREEKEELEEELAETEEFEDTEEDEAKDTQETGAGLAREELQRERLHAGDTIEYYSMAFVFGDPRGHCIAKVLKIMKHEAEYPLRLDSQEMLPSTQMIKRKANRRGEDLAAGSAVWRKIRTFKLIDGRVEGATRANRLNAGITQAMVSAFEAVRKEVFHKATLPPENDTKSSTAGKITGLIRNYFHAEPPAPTKSYKRERQESVTSTPLEKKPRIARTPPTRGDDMSRKPLRPASAQSRSPTHRRDREDLHVHKSPASSKFSLIAFVNKIEEKKRSPHINLNSYLMLDKQQKDAFSVLQQTNEYGSRAMKEPPRPQRRVAGALPSSGSSSGPSRMRAGSQAESSAREKKPGKMRARQNFFKAPPRPHPTATKSTTDGADQRTSRLSFMMDAEPSNSTRNITTQERRKHDDRSHRRHDSTTSKSPKKQSKLHTSQASHKPRMDTWTSSQKR